MTQRSAIALRSTEAPAEDTAAREPHLVAVESNDAATAAERAAIWMKACPPPSVWSGEALHRRMLAACDVTAIFVAYTAVLSRFGAGIATLVALATSLLVVLVFKLTRLYDHEEVRLGHSTLDEIPLLLQLSALVALGLAILRPAFASHGLTSAEIAMLWMASFAGLVTGRVVARATARRLVPAERCLIIGDFKCAERIRERMAASRARVEIVAQLSGKEIHTVDSPEVLRDLVHELSVHRIIIAPISTSSDAVLELTRMAKAVGVRLSILPRMLEVVGSTGAFDEVEGMTMLGVPRFGLARSSRAVKRAFDLVATSVGMLLVSPVIAGIAIAIRLDSKGSIFFRQIRVGRDGQQFSIIKFRSMVADADHQKDSLRSLNIAGHGLFKVKNDPRVTRVGSLLRRTSLDELPQLFNVLRGEMSLVGPRPLVTDEDAQVLGHDRARLRLKPGMTGPWQLLGTRVPLDEMVEIDYLYASNWSLWLDFKILLKTVRHVVRCGNV